MIICPSCGRENQDHYKFCLGCGTELSKKSNVPVPLPEPPAPEPPAPATPVPQATPIPAAVPSSSRLLVFQARVMFLAARR